MDQQINHKHKATLDDVFRHPIDAQIDWNRVVKLFDALGADVDETKHGRLKVKLNGQEDSFAIPHQHQVHSKDEVMEIRKFLENAGVSPDSAR